MSERPRTMTAERETDIRAKIDQFWGGSNLLAEIDAERAAHDSREQTIREHCARIAESMRCHVDEWSDWDDACNEIAAAIRSGE